VVSLRAMDEADRAEQETLLDVYWHALQTPDRIDARLAAGESQRDIAAAEGVSKSTVQRRGPKVKGAAEPSEMDHHKPEDGDDGITESCGQPAATVSEVVDERVNAAAPGPHDSPALEPGESRTTVPLDRRQSEASASLDLAYNEVQPPTTPSVGAVGPQARVAPPDIDISIPSFLRRSAA